jgi:hypothetical protein
VSLTIQEELTVATVAARRIREHWLSRPHHDPIKVVLDVRPLAVRAIGYKTAGSMMPSDRSEVVAIIRGTLRAVTHPRVHPG